MQNVENYDEPMTMGEIHHENANQFSSLKTISALVKVKKHKETKTTKKSHQIIHSQNKTTKHQSLLYIQIINIYYKIIIIVNNYYNYYCYYDNYCY